jgi:hypothetical protein
MPPEGHTSPYPLPECGACWETCLTLCVCVCCSTCQGPAPRRVLGPTAVTLTGIANTVMEDHFAEGRHYSHVVVVLDTTGERVVVRGLLHATPFTGQRVSINATAVEPSPLSPRSSGPTPDISRSRYGAKARGTGARGGELRALTPLSPALRQRAQMNRT